MKILPTQFDGQSIRRVYDEATEIWWFSVTDIVQVLMQQADNLTARKYWNQLKRRLAKEGSQLVTACHQLKMPAADGKLRLTDAATAETLLRLVQSIPSPKAEPIKLWLAKVGYERMQEMADPALSLNRARETWQQHGRSEKWIAQRMTGQETRNKLTDYWSEHDIQKGGEFAILTNIIHQEWAGGQAAQSDSPASHRGRDVTNLRAGCNVRLGQVFPSCTGGVGLQAGRWRLFRMGPYACNCRHKESHHAPTPPPRRTIGHPAALGRHHPPGAPPGR